MVTGVLFFELRTSWITPLITKMWLMQLICFLPPTLLSDMRIYDFIVCIIKEPHQNSSNYTKNKNSSFILKVICFYRTKHMCLFCTDENEPIYVKGNHFTPTTQLLGHISFIFPTDLSDTNNKNTFWIRYIDRYKLYFSLFIIPFQLVFLPLNGEKWRFLD